MSVYARGRKTATRLLKKFNQGTLVLNQRADTAETSEPWDGHCNPPKAIPINGTVTGVPSKLVDGKLIISSDLLVTTAVVDNVEPGKNSTVVINGVEHEIVAFMPVPPARPYVVWRFVVRL